MPYLVKIYSDTTTFNDEDVIEIDNIAKINIFNVEANAKKLVIWNGLFVPQISVFCQNANDTFKVYAFNTKTKEDNNNVIYSYLVTNEGDSTSKENFTGNSNPYFGDKKIGGFIIENTSLNNLRVEFGF